MCLCGAIQKGQAVLLSFSITQGVFGSKWIVWGEQFILASFLVSSSPPFCLIFSVWNSTWAQTHLRCQELQTKSLHHFSAIYYTGLVVLPTCFIGLCQCIEFTCYSFKHSSLKIRLCVLIYGVLATFVFSDISAFCTLLLLQHGSTLISA